MPTISGSGFSRDLKPGNFSHIPALRARNTGSNTPKVVGNEVIYKLYMADILHKKYRHLRRDKSWVLCNACVTAEEAGF